MDDHLMIKMTYDLPPDILQTIGEIGVAYGQLEHALAMAIKRTSKGMTVEEALVLVESCSARLDRAKERFDVWYQDQKLEADFAMAIERARAAARKRHEVMHALWGKDTAGDLRWLHDGWYNKLDLAELQQIRDELYRATTEINGTTLSGTITFNEETTAAASYKIMW